MATKVICYACASSFGEGTPARHSAAGDRVCPACGSDFIEVADVPPLPPPRPPGAEGGAGPGPGRPQFFTAGPGMFGLQVGGGGLDGLPHMMVGAASEHLLGALREHLAGGPALHGARVVLQYGGLEPGFRPGQPGTRSFSFGDFAFGNFEQILEQLMEAHQPTFLPTARSTMDSLLRRTVTASGLADKETPADARGCKAGEPCTVCHDDFVAGITVVELPCLHCFHEDCILPWLETHNTCPVCRSELPAGEPLRSVEPEVAPGPGPGAEGNVPQGPRLPDLLNIPRAMEEWLQHAQGAFSVELQRLEHEQEEHLREHSEVRP